MEALKALKDKYYLVYMIFLLQGVGMLMPFNMFINANDYFVKFKLVLQSNETDKTYYQKLFLQNLTFASILPQVLILWTNIFLPFKGRKNTMVICCLTVEIFLFLLTVIFAMVDSTTWTPAFFWLTMVTMAALSIGNGFFQSVMFGLASKLPSKYIAAVVSGNNLSGIFTAIVAIIAYLSHPDPQLQGVYYFIVAIIVLVICLDTYLVLPLNKYYRLHDMVDRMRMVNENPEKPSIKIPYWKIYLKAFPQLANVSLIFLVTCSIFPAIQANVKPYSMDFFMKSTMFMHVTCFLNFNLFACIGSWSAGFYRWPSKKYLVIPVVLRFLFIPFFLFSNYQVHGVLRTLPVYIVSDWLYWFGAILLAFTSGYLSSVALQYVPTCVDQQYAYIAGMFGGAMLLSGIFAGILLAYLWPYLIK